jgi:glycosyltransferase involved in cell wall biosynthesis
VATPIAVEGMEIEAGSEALVASEPAQFADEIVRLYRDPELWLKLSDAGLANIRAHFSFEAASAALERILKR